MAVSALRTRSGTVLIDNSSFWLQLECFLNFRMHVVVLDKIFHCSIRHENVICRHFVHLHLVHLKALQDRYPDFLDDVNSVDSELLQHMAQDPTSLRNQYPPVPEVIGHFRLNKQSISH